MDELVLNTTQTPGVVIFENYEEVKASLQTYINETFAEIDYEKEGLKIASADYEELKKMRDAVSKKQKELEKAYSAPYVTVESMLKEIVSIIDVPYKKAKTFVETAEKSQKKNEVMKYAEEKASEYGEIGKKIIESQAFFNSSWVNKSTSAKSIHDVIDSIFQQAASDINTIQAIGGEHTSALMARYYETLSMDGVKSFLASLNETNTIIDPLSVESENNVLGYKVLKITATEDQMASILDQLEMMGVDAEEIEDGMPKAMQELTIPDFDSFVAFDIETTGSNGAANGDSEAQITEIGAVRVVNGRVVEKFDQLANPGRPITPMISRITHITNEMVADMPPVDEVIKMFYQFVGDSILVGHNIKSSDLRYITKAAKRAGIHFDVPFLDTYLLAKRFKKSQGWEKVNLGYLAQRYGFEHKEAHRAWSDAEVNAEVYFELQKLDK
ncbi:MAG: DUF1351 domain-containing protein [Lachnospiraceae bacterium]|nr:DUF1351 domain-containing protein [Lachnospiraceae bacterium]